MKFHDTPLVGAFEIPTKRKEIGMNYKRLFEIFLGGRNLDF